MDRTEQARQLRELADAMVVGALLRPQSYHNMYDPNHGTCALGAVYEGSGGEWKNAQNLMGHLVKQFPVLITEYIGGPTPCTIAWEIIRLNDELRLTREQIAAWLYGLSQSLEPEVTQAATVALSI